MTHSRSVLGAFALAMTLLTSSSAFAFGGFAAIVVDTTNGAWGCSFGSSSQEEADAVALSFCPKCVNAIKKTNAKDGWVALATGDQKHIGLSKFHGDQTSAEQSAIDECGGEAFHCKVIRSTSSFVSIKNIDGIKPAPKAPAQPN